MLKYMSNFLKKQLNKFSNLKSKFGKKSQMALVGILAMIMLIIFFSGISKSESKTSSSLESKTTKSTTDYVINLENRLQTIISSIKGVGETRVFVMVDASVETIYATNEDIDKDDTNSSTSTEIVFSKNGSETIPVKKLEIYPEIKGVLIVSRELDDEKKRLMVINAVSVALDLEISKIEVLEGSNE